ncbi:MAG: MaoC family dehydratase [Nitrososphaerota archaeon]|nr:MaoC family dehydratase [Nitrososphaerota archaeon]
MRFKGKVGRTVTDPDNIWFTLLTNNNNQIHFNSDYAKKNFPGEPFRGRMVVNGFLTLATVAGILVEQTSTNGFMLGMSNVRFLNPVFAGDTIYAECEVTAARRSESRPGNGVVSIRTRGYNQRKEKVIEFDRDFMVRERGTVWGPAGGRRPGRKARSG